MAEAALRQEHDQPVPRLAPTQGAWRLVERGRVAWGPGVTIVSDDYLHAGGMFVMSSVEFVEGAWEYHVSVSLRGRNGPARALNDQVAVVLRDFGIEDADEDNHVPGGKARNFWKKVVGPTEACPCKATEEPHDEGHGYVWRDVPARGAR